MNLNNLSVEELLLIYKEIYKNAIELLNDSILLMENERFSRSYLCAQIAIEEFGKLPMINTVASAVNNKQKVDWKKLNKRLRDHHSKNKQSILMYKVFFTLVIGPLLDDENDMQQISIGDFKREIDRIMINPNELITLMPKMLLYQSTKNGREIEEIASNRNKLKNHSLYADYHKGNFLKPSIKINKGDAIKIFTEATIQKIIIEMPKIHVNGFKFG